MATQSFRSKSNPRNHTVVVDGVIVGQYGRPPFNTDPSDWEEIPYQPIELRTVQQTAPGSQALYDYYISQGHGPADASRLSNFTPGA